MDKVQADISSELDKLRSRQDSLWEQYMLLDQSDYPAKMALLVSIEQNTITRMKLVKQLEIYNG